MRPWIQPASLRYLSSLSRRLDLVLLLHAQPRGREGGDVLAVHGVVELLDRADDLLPLHVRVRVLVLVVLDAEQVLGAEQHVRAARDTRMRYDGVRSRIQRMMSGG